MDKGAIRHPQADQIVFGRLSMRSKYSFTAAGDFLMQRHMPETYHGFEEVRDFILRGDFRFFNLETVFTDEHCYGNQFYGGAYLRADPEVLGDTLRYGFNMVTIANNHSLLPG